MRISQIGILDLAAVAVAVAVAVASSFVSAYDPTPLQDFCVAVPDDASAVFVNGKFCKDPKLVTDDDFFASGLNVQGIPIKGFGFYVNVIDLNVLPALNTLGFVLTRTDIEPSGLVPLHTHPRASELFFVTEGTLYVGFTTSNPANNTKNQFFTKTLNAGDVFLFPHGLIHFLYNVGKTKALGYAIFNSQNPGTITLGNAVFGTEPPISKDVLAKNFKLDKKVIDYLQSQSW